jgi:hypothetical protein
MPVRRTYSNPFVYSNASEIANAVIYDGVYRDSAHRLRSVAVPNCNRPP